jgi:hypothetical protein
MWDYSQNRHNIKQETRPNIVLGFHFLPVSAPGLREIIVRLGKWRKCRYRVYAGNVAGNACRESTNGIGIKLGSGLLEDVSVGAK